MKYTVLSITPYQDSQSNIAVRVDVKVGSKTLVLLSTEVDDYGFNVLLADGEMDGYSNGYDDLTRIFRKPLDQTRPLWHQLERLVGHAQAAMTEVAEQHKDEVLAATLASVARY